MSGLTEKLAEIGIVPVIVIEDAADALPLARALVEGGLPCAEVTFRTPAAAESLRIMLDAYPDMLAGAGTVLTKEQADRAMKSGARFIVSPDMNPDVVSYVLEKNMLMIPGTCTPSDVGRALSLGLTQVKFFPAEASGGMNMLKALAGPFPQVSFMPTGGLNRDNIRTYLSYEKVFCCGGTWIVKSDLLKEKRFDEIERLAREAAELVREVRYG